MPSSGGSGSYGARPSRPSRIDLGFHDDDDVELDYSGHAGPSNPSHRTAPLHHHPSSSRLDNHHHRKSTSPQPDADVLAYIRAQKHNDHLSTSPHQLELAEQLKKEKFQHGASKQKSRVQKEREAEERKKKQAEQDAKTAYDEFVAAMGGDEDQREAGGGQERTRKAMGFVGAGGKKYVGSRGEAGEAQTTKVSPMKRDSAFAEEPDVTPSQPPARKARPMSSFLTELQLEQAQRESRLSTLASTTNTSISTLLAQESTTTTKSTSQHPPTADPLTTNICIPSLPPNIDERSMGEFFSQWGDVATVKIMWPRGEQQRERPGGLTGFVAYMTRDRAETAFREVDGVTWGGVRVKCSWGKAMSLPKRALYPCRQKVEKTEEKIGSVAGGGGVKKLVIRHRRNGKGREERRKEIRDRLEAECEGTQRLFVETVASRIRANGVNFEHVLREREADNPRFAFLFEPNSLLHQYFRICLDAHYVPSTINDESQQKPFTDDGSDELYSTDSGEESETRHLTSSHSSSSSTTPLAPLAHHRLCSMLRSLTPRRERIARITSFALDHSSSYPSIVDILTTSLLQPSTPIPRKLARLYCISDLLHNSGTPISNAWRYRAALEEKLPLVFAHLGMVARTFEGRMRREEWKGKVREVLDVWEGWIVVAPDVLERCRRVFECPPVTSQRQGERADKVIVEEREDVYGEAFVSHTSLAVKHDESTSIDEEEDLDGEAL